MHPAKIGPYQIERKIGAGGMGTVYQGRHVETGELAAVKVLPASMAREEGFVARFNREIEAVQKLSNPHIVGFLESGVENETYWYAMEFVDGETLTARLRRDGKLGWKEAVRISLQICIALKAAHDMGIVHRDLKPSNLMLDQDGNVKLTDFGVAQVFAASRLTVTGGIIGTAEYMSPEQAQGRRATKKSDLYSLGAVMYVMLTGRPPFSGKSTVDVIQKQRFGQFDRPRMYVDDLPYWLDELVCQLLEKNPDDRLADAYVLSRRLKEIEKKVELSQSGHTLGHETSGSYDGDAPTVSAELMATHAEEGFGGPGPGTLMRDLVRAEIELASEGGRFSRLMNSTWFLVTMLLLLIAGGVWWFRTPALSPEEQFEAGQEIMARGEGPEWLKARDEYFEPLMQEDPERWRDEVAPFLERIEFYALQESVRPSPLRRERNETDEPRRFLRLARHYRDVGDRAAATRVLESLCLLLQYHQNEQATLELARQMLAELEDPGENQETLRPFIAASLAEAERLQQAGESTAARQILRSIVSLYAGDPLAAAPVAEARRLLGETTESAVESGAETAVPPETEAELPAGDSAATDQSAATTENSARVETETEPETSPAAINAPGTAERVPVRAPEAPPAKLRPVPAESP